MTQKYTAQSIRGDEMGRRKKSLQVFGQGQGWRKITSIYNLLNLIKDFCGIKDSLQVTTIHTYASLPGLICCVRYSCAAIIDTRITYVVYTHSLYGHRSAS